jgi:hypothetical protein
MPPVGFEPTIPTSERPQTHAVDRADNGIDFLMTLVLNVMVYLMKVQCVFFGVGAKYKRIVQTNITV